MSDIFLNDFYCVILISSFDGKIGFPHRVIAYFNRMVEIKKRRYIFKKRMEFFDVKSVQENFHSITLIPSICCS